MKSISAITLTDGSTLRVRTRVIWCPDHAMGDLSHPKCRVGTVSSFTDGRVCVRFDDQVNEKGWDITPGETVLVRNLWVLEDEKPGLWERLRGLI